MHAVLLCSSRSCVISATWTFKDGQGIGVGAGVGIIVGESVGANDGEAVGEIVGEAVGVAVVGVAVGTEVVRLDVRSLRPWTVGKVVGESVGGKLFFVCQGFTGGSLIFHGLNLGM